jgi:hypothetical protein
VLIQVPKQKSHPDPHVPCRALGAMQLFSPATFGHSEYITVNMEIQQFEVERLAEF